MTFMSAVYCKAHYNYVYWHVQFTNASTKQFVQIDNMFMYFVHLFVTDIFFISMAAKDMYSVWFHWTPSLDLSSARVFQVWMSRSHDQGLHRTIFFKMAPLFSMWHARTQQKGNGFLCKCI